MARGDTQIVGAAGEHFVAFRLAQLGHVVALPRGGSPTVDLLVSNPSGTKTVTVQVKTAEWGERERGRGAKRRVALLDFALGHRAAEHSAPRFLYSFVDLQGREPSSCPTAYIVPSTHIVAYCEGWVDDVSMVRWQPTVEEARPYRNRWNRITRLLR